MQVEDAAYRVNGFVDGTDVRFLLRSETAIVKDHVWLKQGIAVHVLGAEEPGVAVAVARDDERLVAGFAEIPAHVPCGELLFEAIDPTGGIGGLPTPEPVANEPASAETTYVYPARSTLALYTAPGEKALARFGDEKSPFSTSLVVLGKRAGYTRVAFDTTYARFDVWAKDSDLVKEVGGWGDAFGSSSCCGGLGLVGISERPRKIKEDTAVAVGKTPGAPATGTVTILKGVEVDITERKAGWVAVKPRMRSIVNPPTDNEFWVPLDRVE
jgi:hypothetical protein